MDSNWQRTLNSSSHDLIGASLSEPHTRELNDKKCLCVCQCAPHVPSGTVLIHIHEIHLNGQFQNCARSVARAEHA